jgi:hypothetical protein
MDGANRVVNIRDAGGLGKAFLEDGYLSQNGHCSVCAANPSLTSGVGLRQPRSGKWAQLNRAPVSCRDGLAEEPCAWH